MKNIMREDDWQLGMGLEERPVGREESSLAERAGGGAAEEGASAVRLRRPERRQMAMVVECPDDLVSATHPVRRGRRWWSIWTYQDFASRSRRGKGWRGATRRIRAS